MEHNLNSISKTKPLKTLTPQTHPHTIPLTKGGEQESAKAGGCHTQTHTQN